LFGSIIREGFMIQVFFNYRKDIAAQPRLRLSWLIPIGLFIAFIVGMMNPQHTYAQGLDCSDTATTGVPQAECETLVAFYTSTGGSSWTTRTNWITPTAVDNWYGVTVSGGHVTELLLHRNNLTGTLPNLSALTYVQKLELDFGYLTGNIPSLSSLTQLQYLALGVNHLNGSLPDLSGLTNLQYLNLFLNDLTGNLSNLSTLTQLNYLNLAYNDFTGSPSAVAGLNQVTELWLNDNQLTGTIPDLTAFTQLQKLYLSNNQLVSMVPASIMSTAIGTTNSLRLCGGNNITATTDPTVAAWVVARQPGWTQGCGLGTAPAAVADPNYSTPENTPLTIAAPGVLTNDAPGTPAGTLTFFGAGSLGGAVTDYAAGTTVSPLPTYSDGSLQVNANGSFVFTPPTGFSGAYTFQYRIDNGVGTSDATVTIQTPTLSINDTTEFESNSEFATFTVTRTGTAGITTVQFTTVDGTALAGLDYITTSGTLTFADGVATQSINVPLYGDKLVETNETFTVVLSSPTNATITDGEATGTITNSTPELIEPTDALLTNDNTPRLRWRAITGADMYRVQIATDAAFTNVVVNVPVTTLYYTPDALADRTYYWRVRARNAAANWGDYCTAWSVTIDTTPPPTPVRIRPANGSTTNDNTPLFQWYASDGAVMYQLLVVDSTDVTVIDRTQTQRSYTPTTALVNGTYRWQVRAQDAAGNWSGWGIRWSFTVNAGSPIQPTIIPTNTPRPTRTPQPTLVPTDVPTATMTEIVSPLPVVESDQPIVVQSGVWAAYDDAAASGGRYLLSSAPTDTLTLAFAGSEVTVVYAKHPSLGSFAIEVDGMVLQTVDSVAAETIFGAEATISGLAY
jgi:hypothetical protein